VKFSQCLASSPARSAVVVIAVTILKHSYLAKQKDPPISQI